MIPAAREAVRGFPIRRTEIRRVSFSFLHFFTLFAAYSMLRPLRDEMSVRAGVPRLPWLFTGTLAAALLLVPAFGWAASRIPRRTLLAAIPVLGAASLVVFFFALDRASGASVSGAIFVVWVAVFGLFAVSVSWSGMADVYGRDEARRLFGYVAAGSSAGAIAGPAAMALSAPRVDPRVFLLMAAGLLVLSAASVRPLERRHRGGRRPGPAAAVAGPLSGVRRTLGSPVLLVLALALLCQALVSTFLYFSQTQAVGLVIRGSADRTALFARIDVAVNTATLFLQVFCAGPVIRRAGPGGALAVAAGVATAGVLWLAVAPGLLAVIAVQVLHRAGQLGIARPARESLFVSLDPQSRYEAKSFLDTAVYRAGDSASAWLLGATRLEGAGVGHGAWLIVPAGLVWTAAGVWLGRRTGRRTEISASSLERRSA